jgi:hypothetical protein
MKLLIAESKGHYDDAGYHRELTFGTLPAP